jgi:tetratricopeptide (TPR) repeat protein
VRSVPRHRILVVGSYRDVELDRTHPLAESLGELRREAEFDRMRLGGLDAGEVSELLAKIAEHDVPEAFVAAVADETGGVPFFIREVLLHLAEEGKIFQDEDGRWTSKVTVQEMGIPEGVREVIGRRVSRLSPAANRLLGAAAVFEGPFRLDVAATVADVSETEALDAVDEALAAQMVAPGDAADTYVFTHALIRHTLEAELNPSRQVRAHRRVAEALEATYGDRPTAEQSAEIAYQYHRSAAIPGGERGVDHAVRAADHASETGAHDEAAAFLEMATELLPTDDPRRPRVLGKLALSMGWALRVEDSARLAREASELILAADGPDAAANYLAEALGPLGGGVGWSGPLAQRGLELIGDRRDQAWAYLKLADINRRESEDPDWPGIPHDTPEKRDVRELLPNFPPAQLVGAWRSRDDVLAHPGVTQQGGEDFFALFFYAGEHRRALANAEHAAVWAEANGHLGYLGLCSATISRCCSALGDFARAREFMERAWELADRIGPDNGITIVALGAQDELNMARDEGWEDQLATTGSLSGAPGTASQYVFAAIQAALARVFGRLGNVDTAMSMLEGVIVPLDRAPGSAINYTRIACDAAETLWLCRRTEHIDLIERCLREKVIAPDFRYGMFDGRLATARLCALGERFDEAGDWFAAARRVFDEQGARPLRAIADFDEALMHTRRGSDRGRDWKPLLEASQQQFEHLGMTGWLRRVRSVLEGNQL